MLEKIIKTFIYLSSSKTVITQKNRGIPLTSLCFLLKCRIEMTPFQHVFLPRRWPTPLNLSVTSNRRSNLQFHQDRFVWINSDHDPSYFDTDPVEKISTIVFERDLFETHTHLLSSASIFLSFSLATCSSFLLAPFDSSSLPEKKGFPNQEEGCPKHLCKVVRYAHDNMK